MQIDWWTFVLQGINFLVLVWLLWRFLYRPVRAIIEKRKEVAEQAFAKADAAAQEAAEEKKKFEAAQAQLAQDRRDTIKTAHEETAAEREKILGEAQREADRIVEKARATVAREREAALKDLREEIIALAGDLAGKILRGAGPKIADEAFLDRLDERLTSLPDEEREHLSSDLAADGARLTVTTAVPLDDAAQDRWRDRLAACLGHRDRIDFATDADLLGGAELRFPHAVLSCSWADQLKEADELLQRDDEAS